MISLENSFTFLNVKTDKNHNVYYSTGESGVIKYNGISWSVELSKFEKGIKILSDTVELKMSYVNLLGQIKNRTQLRRQLVIIQVKIELIGQSGKV